MLISVSVSIIDKHKPSGQQHVGTYTFEIEYSGDSHFELLALPCPVEHEDACRFMVGRLMTKQDFINEGEPFAEIER